MRKLVLAAAIGVIFGTPASAATKPAVKAAAAATVADPLLAPWGGPHGGVPPFDQVRVDRLQPALEAALASQRRELRSIAANPAPATFDNTIVALERAQLQLGRVRSFYELWTGSLKTPAVEALEQAMAPKLAAMSDELYQNKRLFARIEAVYNAPATRQLTPEQQRLVAVYRTQFVKQGARLDTAQKQRVAQINQRLAERYTRFNQNQLGDEQERALTLTHAADLDGLSASDIAAYASEAAQRGLKGQWVVANTRSAMEPLLLRAKRRDLRERGFRLWTGRGDLGDGHDNNGVVVDILALRAERSRLLGFASFAHWQLSDTMAGDPQRAMDLMLQVWRPAVAAARQQVAEMQALVNAGPAPFKIEPWDYRFVAEQLRQQRYAFDANELMPYLQLDKVREAMFWAAGRLYGYRFVPIADVPVFHPDVSVYEVQSRAGERVGLWYFDPYARAGKNSGAWMSSFRAQSRMNGPQTAIVSNNSNFTRGVAGEAVLLSWDDAVTMFHEFGHALHGLSSNVVYPSLSGTATLLDFAEVPSMLNENWLAVPEVLSRLTNAAGQPLPRALVDKIKRSSNFDKGFSKTEFLASALLDMRLHLLDSAPADPRAFEKTVLAELGMPAEIVPRHRIPAFGHLFANEGYAAGYYAYLWAEVIEHDAFEAFSEAGNAFDPALAQRLRDTIMSVGNTVDPAQAFRNFRGRDATVDALLRDSGFAPPARP